MSLVLMGGGLDSTAVLLYLKRCGYSCAAIHFQYGQIAGLNELASVRHFCTKYDVPLKVVHIPINQIASSAILRDSVAENSNKLEGRNAIFVMMAATYAATMGYHKIFLGYHLEPEPAPFPDATMEAFKSMQIAINNCYSTPLALSAPFSNSSRFDILKLGAEWDSEFLTHTHTCYLDIVGGCGECAHCNQKAVMIHNLTYRRNDPIPGNS